MQDKLGLHTLDAGAVGVMIATIFGYLPNIAALLTVVWMALRVYEAYLNVLSLRKELDQKDKAKELITTITEKVKTDDIIPKP